LTLEQCVNETEPIFENELTIPEAPVKFKDQIDSLDEANLPRQKSACIYAMRRWQAEKMGFKEFTVAELVEMLMGEPHNNKKDGEKHNIEWVYEHHNDKVCTSWHRTAMIYYRVEKKGFWYLPPFAKQVKWEVQHGSLDYLKREIPYGVVLKINELKKLKFFNSFSIVAPMEAWWKQKDIDPIVIAHLYQIPPDDKGEYSNAGELTNHFIAKW
jgi:hypothetical protein